MIHRHAPCEEVSEVHEFAVLIILNVDDTPSVFAATHGLAIDDYIAF